MLVTLPGGTPQNWGDEILINITDAIAPVDSENYQVLIKASEMDGATVRNVACLSWQTPDSNNEISFDLAPYLNGAYTYHLEFYEGYNPVINAELGDWVTNALPELSTDVEIVNAVIIETANYTIPGGAVQLSGNPVQVIVPSTSGDMTGKSNYKRALKVSCTALIGNPLIEEITPDADLLSTFDISGLVDQPAEYDFQFPAVGVVTDHRALELNVALDVGEIYIDGNGARQVAWEALAPETNSIRILKGFLRPYELAKLAEIGRSFNSEYINKGKFLTHLPDRMKVSPSQIVKLWYLSRYTSIVSAEWHCSVTQMTLNGPYTFTYLMGDCNLDPASGLLEFNINPLFMGFYQFVDDTFQILEYSFWLEKKSDHSKISEVRTFEVDNNYYENQHTFYYVNPLSGIDCIWLTGQQSESLKTEKETAYKPVPFGSGTKVAGMKTTSASGLRTWELNTGYKSKEEILALRDFLESRECWMVDPDLPIRLIPVIVEAGEFILFDSAPEFVPNLGIKILEAHK
jgi:hypothetical protein